MPYVVHYNEEEKILTWFNREYSNLGTDKNNVNPDSSSKRRDEYCVKDKRLDKHEFLYIGGSLSSKKDLDEYAKKLYPFEGYTIIPGLHEETRDCVSPFERLLTF
jgi:hypothetical protein